MATGTDIDELIARIGRGDRKALSSLYAATAPKLYGIALHVLGDRAEAETALQDVFVNLWHNADRSRADGLSPMGWLIALARNHATSRLRGRAGRRAEPLDEAAELADLSPGAGAAAPGRRAPIEDCLAALEPDRADAVRRAYLRGETYAELALRYRVPLNTVRGWLRRSLLKLRKCLG
jgi:RNA polymerase sigma-70 factor (ECF subfamily)